MQHKERASAHMVLTHYTELLDKKHLILARAEVASGELSVPEARDLVAATHAFYTQPERQKTVEAFNRGASSFSFAEVLTACGVTPPK